MKGENCFVNFFYFFYSTWWVLGFFVEVFYGENKIKCSVYFNKFVVNFSLEVKFYVENIIFCFL